MTEDKLTDYRTKRSGSHTSEPSGSAKQPAKKEASRPAGTSSQQPRFVVQRHGATTLHFDFRLEIGDVLVSWAVPQGPSVNPSDKASRTAPRTTRWTTSTTKAGSRKATVRAP